jgi:methylated-DNA-protein-cysteine methyltransferase related protein
MSPSRRASHSSPSREPAGWSRFYAAVRRIPRGRVATYGQVAALAGRPGHARQAGYALHALGEHTTVPWHRVVNAQGRLSLARRGHEAAFEQRFRLEREGVVFDARGRVPLARFGWKRPRPKKV